MFVLLWLSSIYTPVVDRCVTCLHHVVEDGDFDHKEAREREDAPDIGVAREEVEA